jgi:hypothetical protein
MYYFNVYAGSKHMDLVKAFDESEIHANEFAKQWSEFTNQ